jgi:hypothetical protein
VYKLNFFIDSDKQVDILDMKGVKNGDYDVAIDKGTLDSIVVRRLNLII